MKRKSIGTAVVLTALLGPLGLFYISAGQAVIAIVLALVVIPVALGSVGSGAAIMLSFWGILVAVAWSMTAKHNKEIRDREITEERRHQELLQASRRQDH